MNIDQHVNLFKALGLAVMVCEEDGGFRLAGDAPLWFRKLCRHATWSPLPTTPPEEQIPFLSNFMVDAKAFWALHAEGRLRSGIWIQSLPDGTEIALEASAAMVDHEKLLLIESCDFEHTEKQSLIQTGRQLELDIDQHRRRQLLSEHMRLELEVQVQQHTKDLIQSNACLKAEVEERQRAQRSLGESERRFRTLFDNLFDAQVLVDAEGRIRDVNRAACRLMSNSRENLSGRLITDLFPAHEADSIHEALVTAAREGMVYIDETILHREGQPAIPVEGGGVSLEMDGGLHVVFSFHDVSYRKKLQFQLQQAQKMEAMGTLASGIAHDFNNILSAIIGYTEIVRMDLSESSQSYQNLNQVLAAGNRAKNLVQQILTFSRQAEAVSKPVKIKAVVAEALKLMRATLPSSIQIQQILTSQSYVRCDPTQIHQICINLCTNAGQSMEEEGGMVTVHLNDVTVDDGFASTHPRIKPGPYVRLSVADTGSGIPETVIGKIFDPFFTTKAFGRGTGMGLSVVHGIVTTTGGAITVENQPGSGCCFDVYLPILSGQVSDSPVDRSAMPTGTECILFVDDETFQVDLASQVLARLGYDVIAKTGSIEALSCFEQDPAAFDVVITDMTMPVLSGKKLAQRIHTIRPDLPIILCSGFSSSISDDAACKMGFATYLKKPLVMKEMAVAIRQALDRRDP